MKTTDILAVGVALVSSQTVPAGGNVYRIPNARVLATHGEIPDYGHPLRIVVDDGEQKAVKYLFLDSKVLQPDLPLGHGQWSIDLPRLPSGDWDQAFIHLDRHTGTPTVSNTTRASLPDLMDKWHSRHIDYLDFDKIETLQHDRLQVVTHPDFDDPVLIKIASFPWEIASVEREATMYKILNGSGATPEFLGHVTESGRAIGFVTEYIPERPSTSGREMQGCMTALRRLHHRGVVHGDAHDGNCLIRQDGTAALIDFELSLETWSSEEFERDLDIMGRCIQAQFEEV